MSQARKLTPDEMRLEVERMEAEERAEQERAIAVVRAKSPKDVHTDLVAAGVDTEKLRQRAEALAKRFSALAAEKAPALAEDPAPSPSSAPSKQPPPAKVVSLPPRPRRSRMVWLAVALVAALAAAYIARRQLASFFSGPPSERETPLEGPGDVGGHRGKHPGTPGVPGAGSAAPGTNSPDIAAIRRNAIFECRHMRWAPCLSGLDLARTYDPAGESDPLVTLARKQATLALQGSDAMTNENAKTPP